MELYSTMDGRLNTDLEPMAQGRPRGDGSGVTWVAITRPDFAARIMAETDSGGGGRGSSEAVAISSSPAQPSQLPLASPQYRARKAAQIWGELQKDLAGILGACVF